MQIVVMATCCSSLCDSSLEKKSYREKKLIDIGVYATSQLGAGKSTLLADALDII